MEKGYRDYGHDIDNTDGARGRARLRGRLDKPGGFIGRDAVLAKKAAGPLQRRLVQVLVEDPRAELFRTELVLRDGKWVGYVRAAALRPHARRAGGPGAGDPRGWGHGRVVAEQ